MLLHDERAAERADTADVLAEAEHVAGALRSLGYEPLIEPVGLDLAAVERLLARCEPLAVFNLVESLGGRAELIHVVPALLEALAVPFTGCPSAAQHLTSNKLDAKRVLAASGIAVPETWSPGVGGFGPWIAKSVWEHASLGIDDGSIVERGADVPELIARRRAEWGGAWFAERLVDGRELNAALISSPNGILVLPIAEILFDELPAEKPRIVGYAAKWCAESFEYRATPRRFGLEPAFAERVEAAALACWHAFALEGYARVDFRTDRAGVLHVLEVNANPCLSPDAGFAAALEAAGIPFFHAVAWLLDDALRRAQGPG